jgi:hypothetical protein
MLLSGKGIRIESAEAPWPGPRDDRKDPEHAAEAIERAKARARKRRAARAAAAEQAAQKR